ncbi:MAG TPA: hypothetical protein VE991_04075 [Acidimicrobiales bacterium]|nr:hypothetical protein [Acidimicrobiales bacterium]
MPEQLPLQWDEPAAAGSPAPAGDPAANRRPEDWRLDARTRRVGLKGLARARAALAATGDDRSRGADAA